MVYYKYMQGRGFTVIELVIVVVVIAILATITTATYATVQTRAQSSAISDGLKQIDKSMRLWVIDEGLTQWPYDPRYGGGIPLSQMVQDNPGLNKYLQKIPSVQGIQTDEWFYDNDSDTKQACGNNYAGVNIVIRYVTNGDAAQQVDSAIDDGNLTCGRVRYIDQRIFYSLGFSSDINS